MNTLDAKSESVANNKPLVTASGSSSNATRGDWRPFILPMLRNGLLGERQYRAKSTNHGLLGQSIAAVRTLPSTHGSEPSVGCKRTVANYL